MSLIHPMKRDITDILEEARESPSVLNSQPWRFKVCGNTLEIFLEKNPDLHQLDPHGRLQMASCGTLLSHLSAIIYKRGWQPKIDYFPQFDQENLVAFVEISKPSPIAEDSMLQVPSNSSCDSKSSKTHSSSGNSSAPTRKTHSSSGNSSAPTRKTHSSSTSGSGPTSKTHSSSGNHSAPSVQNSGAAHRNIHHIFRETEQKISTLVHQKDIQLHIHDDYPEYKFLNYFREHCETKLQSDDFQRNLNYYFRSQNADTSCYEDEVLLSDLFFEFHQENPGDCSLPETLRHRLYILYTRTDNRYKWIRSGEVLGNILLVMRSIPGMSMTALPIIRAENCRNWLRKELKLHGYPQFILKMHPAQALTHQHKRPLKELIKYGY